MEEDLNSHPCALFCAKLTWSLLADRVGTSLKAGGGLQGYCEWVPLAARV